MSYSEALDNGELVLSSGTTGRRLRRLSIYDNCFPVRDVDQQTIRAEGVEALNEPERLHALLEAQHYRIASWRTANDSSTIAASSRSPRWRACASSGRTRSTRCIAFRCSSMRKG